MLQTGDRAPIFSADSTQGRFDLSKHIGKHPVVLIFYPKNETPICTKQLCAVRDSKQQYRKYQAMVVGVNSASLQDHEKFAEHHKYDFPLISDEHERINQLYDVGKMLLGLLGQQRVVYVIDYEGKIAYARKGNRPTHEILEALEQVSKMPIS